MSQQKRQSREVRIREETTHHLPAASIAVGDRVRAKTTNRTGEVTQVVHDGAGDQVTVAYDDQPQDIYLTTPARDGVELPRALVDPA